MFMLGKALEVQHFWVLCLLEEKRCLNSPLVGELG